MAAQQQQQLYLRALVQKAAGQDEYMLRRWLEGNDVEQRFGAAYVAGEKHLGVSQQLINLLRDNDLYIQQAARRSLVLLANDVMRSPDESGSASTDRVKGLLKMGPKASRNAKTVQTAIQNWREWWDANDPNHDKEAALGAQAQRGPR